MIFQIEPFGCGRLLRLLANLFLLQMSFYSLTLLFSSFGSEAGRVAILGVMVAILSLLDNVVATLWDKAAFMKPYSLHSYYDPRTILVDGQLATSSILVLGVFAFIATAAAFARFLTRDFRQSFF
jgi:ABC-type transport system involved in multi-copper enzyme maturation permease subunit